MKNNISGFFFDAHCHLTSEKFKNIKDIVKNAYLGFVKIISSGDSYLDSLKTIEIVKDLRKINPFMFATVGFHPYYADEFDISLINSYEKLIEDDVVIALGEIGLDYFRGKNFEKQKYVFQKFLELAVRKDMPVVIHSRESYEDVFLLLEKFSPEIKGVMHCYSSLDKSITEKFMELGFKISFAGQITYPKNDALREIVSFIPFDFLMIETDAPYLSPQPKRGEVNEPLNVVYVADKLAEIKNVSSEDIKRITNYNTLKLYGLKDDSVNSKFIYRVRNKLFVNLTNKCGNKCIFCPKNKSWSVYGYNLKLEKEPTIDEIINAIESEDKFFDEIVFCGLGEPLYRFDAVYRIGKYFKERGHLVRINTNGRQFSACGKNVTKLLSEAVNKVVVSLNALNKEDYNKICNPDNKDIAFDEVMDFIEEVIRYVSNVEVSFIENEYFGEKEYQYVRNIIKNEKISIKLRKNYYNFYD